MPQMTGSDTRMYAPKSESNLGYTNDDDDYRYGIGDPEHMEEVRDKKMAENDMASTVSELPHLQLSVPKPTPEMPTLPGLMEEEEEEPMMDDQFNEGQQFGAMTGMPDMGNLSIGNATGTMPAPGGTLMTGEPMENAWSSLMKEDGRQLRNNAPIHPMPFIEGDNDEVDPVDDYFLNPELVNEQLPDHINPNHPMYIDPRHKHKQYGTSPDMQFSPDFQQKYASEPMENAWSTLMKKDEEDDERPDPETFTKPKKIPRPFFDSEKDVTPIRRRLAAEPRVETSEGDLRAERILPTAYGNPDYFTTGEPMDDAWSSLTKGRLDKVRGKEQKPFSREQFEISPGGADITTANTRRAKRTSRQMSPIKNRGLDLSDHSVDYSHLGIKTKQPLRLFPRDYDQQLGTQQKRQLLAGVPQVQTGHALGPESKYNPKTHKLSSPKGRPIKEPGEPKLRGQSLAKSAAALREDIDDLRKKVDYMKFNQIRRLLNQLKDSVERQERRLKASSGPGEKGEAGHMEGQDKTTKPTGGTSTIELADSWGAPSTLFAAPGSGRVG